MKLVIEGAPRTAKNNQRIVTNPRTGKPFIIASKSKGAWATLLVDGIKRELVRIGDEAVDRGAVHYLPALPISQPIQVKALFYRDRNIGDLDNYAHAVGDALQKAGVILNDKQIESWDKSRKLIDRVRPRVEITIEPFDDKERP